MGNENFGKVRYQLVARICSTTLVGSHFTVTVRTTNNQVYHVDGMKKYNHQKIIDMATQNNLNGRGYAVRANQQNAKDLSALVGRVSQTVAVFYVLHAPILTQDLFFENQRRVARRATHLGPISMSNLANGNPIWFTESSVDQMNRWIPCVEDDITWMDLNSTHMDWEYKVHFSHPFTDLFCSRLQTQMQSP